MHNTFFRIHFASVIWLLSFSAMGSAPIPDPWDFAHCLYLKYDKTSTPLSDPKLPDSLNAFKSLQSGSFVGFLKHPTLNRERDGILIGFNDKTEFEKAEKKAGGLTGFKLVGSGTRERNQDRYIVHFDEIQPDEDEDLKEIDEAAFDDAIAKLKSVLTGTCYKIKRSSRSLAFATITGTCPLSHKLLTDLLDDAPVTYIEPSIVMHAD